MIDNHSKVLAIRCDVRYPQGYPHDGTNGDVSKLMKLVKESHTERKVGMHYVWVREQATSEVPHYHALLLVNGDRVRSPYGILKKMEDVWGRVIGSDPSGLVDHCNHAHDGKPGIGHVPLKRPSSKAQGEERTRQEERFNAARAELDDRASYLIKTHTKGGAPKRVREFGASQLKPKRGEAPQD
ncbi:YagK/YfjJ domain-containing protein [Azospirillum soli]|uniref:YagK/YfjJ domain-containing protein n=1 Tax=Azospirillum soli TaxID=1304799 RepID=UPI001AEA0388|nr:hypothetical protein [Azospirillum soli]